MGFQPVRKHGQDGRATSLTPLRGICLHSLAPPITLVIWAIQASCRGVVEMSSNRWIVAAVFGLFVAGAQVSLAAGGGHAQAGNGHNRGNGHSSGNGHNRANQSQSRIPSFANSWAYLRAENGIFGPVWAAPGPGSGSGFGWGGGGAGWGNGGWGNGGWGWGDGLADIGYYSNDIPYFNLFPPVYYTYSEGSIVPTSTLRSSWMGDSTGQAAPEPPTPASPAVAPLRIANPYYKADSSQPRQ